MLTWTLQSFGFSWLTDVLPRDNGAIDFLCLVLSCSKAQTTLLGFESRMVGCKFPDASLIPGLTVKGVANTCRAKQEDASKTGLGLERINTKTEEHCQKSPDVAMSHGYRNWGIVFSLPVHESYTPRWKHRELHCTTFRTYRPSPHQQPCFFRRPNTSYSDLNGPSALWE